MNFNLWIETLTKPLPTFKREKKNANLMEGVINLAIAGVITGFITGLMGLVFSSAIASRVLPMASGLVGVAAFVGAIILTPIMSVIGWLIMSAIFYVFARFLGGKGDYKTQSYLYAIYGAPLGIIVAIINLIPIIGPIISILPTLYGLYLLTMSLKEAHSYDLTKAILTWLIPVIILVVIAVVIGVTVLAFLMGGMFGGSMPSIPGI